VSTFAAGDHQPSAHHYERDASGRRQKVIVVGIHAEVNIAGIDAMVFGVRDCDKERKNSEYQNYQSDCGESSHAQILRLDCIGKFRSEYISLASDANQRTCGSRKIRIPLARRSAV
jgi:hypothetical protein